MWPEVWQGVKRHLTRMAPNCGEGGSGPWPGTLRAHRGPLASPNPPVLPSRGPAGGEHQGGRSLWGAPAPSQTCREGDRASPRGQRAHPTRAVPPLHRPRGCTPANTPRATHRQLLVGGHLVRQGPDPLVGAVHPQPGAQPRQLLIAPRVVPARGEEATGTAGHRWARPRPRLRPPPAPRAVARGTYQWWWVVSTARSTTSSLRTISSSWKGPGAAGRERRR